MFFKVLGTQIDDDRDLQFFGQIRTRHHRVLLHVLLHLHEIILQIVWLLRDGIVDDRLGECPFRTWCTRFVALHQQTNRFQAVALLNRVADSEKVALGARQQDGVQVESEPQHVLLVVRYALFTSSSVTIASVPAAHQINSSDGSVEMRK